MLEGGVGHAMRGGGCCVESFEWIPDAIVTV